MEDFKVYFIRLVTQDVSLTWSETSPDDYDYDADDFAIDGGTASMTSDHADTISNMIGERGEYLNWLELAVDEIFCEEWLIFDEDCLEDLREHYLAYDDIELIIEESTNNWEKVDGEWQLAE
ncbi:hypothetical protein ACFL6G_06165 [candidate division KSB1 bacterium]